MQKKSDNITNLHLLVKPNCLDGPYLPCLLDLGGLLFAVSPTRRVPNPLINISVDRQSAQAAPHHQYREGRVVNTAGFQTAPKI